MKIIHQIACYLFFLYLFLILPLGAKDFGIQGELFSIQEESIILVLQKQLLSQFSSHTFHDLLKRTTTNAHRPSPSNIPLAEENRTFYFDPTFITSESLIDNYGTVIVPKGTKVNPLKDKHLSSGLLFFDGDNPTHLQWARQQTGIFKWVLVRGNPFEIEQQEKRPIYFDQNGSSISKFQLHSIPAKITQDGLLLKIEEIHLAEERASS